MALKESHGNMYSWVTNMHSHLGGECPHKCSYCYVQRNRFGVSERYKGAVRLFKPEFSVNYGTGKTIFIEHMNDMFAKEISVEWIAVILAHCNRYPKNTYVFQTKNPVRAWDYLSFFPKDFMIGTTIETNRSCEKISNAPDPYERYIGIKSFSGEGFKTFITIEPIMDFDVDILAKWIIEIKPDFVNIGADSKGCGLLEPSSAKIREFVIRLQQANITIKKKVNLERIMR